MTSNPPTLSCPDPFVPAELERGAWIVILRADQMPHVCLLADGLVYSLEHDGNHRYPAVKLVRLIERKRVPSVLVEVLPTRAVAPEPFFRAYEGLAGDTNCFLPVRDAVAAWFEPAATCDYVFELVPRLAAAGRVGRAVAVHVEGRPFVFPRYDQAGIRARIADVRRSRTRRGQAS